MFRLIVILLGITWASLLLVSWSVPPEAPQAAPPAVTGQPSSHT